MQKDEGKKNRPGFRNTEREVRMPRTIWGPSGNDATQALWSVLQIQSNVYLRKRNIYSGATAYPVHDLGVPSKQCLYLLRLTIVETRVN